MTMNPRQAYALAHPLNYAEDALRPEHRRQRRHATGVDVTVILAVDR
jgi:hypothetical protein